MFVRVVCKQKNPGICQDHLCTTTHTIGHLRGAVQNYRILAINEIYYFDNLKIKDDIRVK